MQNMLDSARAIRLSLHGKDKVIETKKSNYHCKALILATGDGMKGIGMKWETWIGGGVAYCAECGAPFFKGKELIIVGNVREASDEALHLTKIAKNVRLINHTNTIGIDRRMRKQLEEEHVSLIEDYIGIEISARAKLIQQYELHV